MVKINLDDHYVVDNHYHAFAKSKETDAFENHWTVSELNVDKIDIRHTLLYRMVNRELKRFLNLPEDATMDEVVEKRNEAYGDEKKYIDGLHRDAKIKTLLVDIGYPNKEFSGYDIDFDYFGALSPSTEIRKMVRIEPIIYNLLQKNLEYTEYTPSFKEAVYAQIEEHKAVALKTVIAYRTGLNIRENDEKAVERCYKRYLAEPADMEAQKVFRDKMFHLALEICLHLDIPLQIHTGMGDAPFLDLRKGNPLDLYGIISAKKYADAKIVLVHAGYPYIAETGHLANHYPNVWVDLSEMIPYAGICVEAKMLELLEMAPTTKIMYGSDNNKIPEIGWFTAVYFKKHFAKVLEKLIADEVIDEQYAYEMAEMILSKNAEKLYKL